MPLKPNVLDDLTKEHHIAAPPERSSYISDLAQDEMMLEDESGRLRVKGDVFDSSYVTGCVLAALGTEQADGTFHAIATQLADLPAQPPRWQYADKVAKQKKAEHNKGGKVAIVSGLELTGHAADDPALDILTEYLTGELGGPPSQANASKITRLIIAGDSLARASPILSRDDFSHQKDQMRKHGGHDMSTYNAAPLTRLDELLSDILPTLPITLLPGATDPANVALPQQPLHPALFPKSRLYTEPPNTGKSTVQGLDSVTNPWSGELDGYRFLGTSGQTVADLQKYIDNVDTLDVLEMMLRWRCIAPTAPDTLWCYPFQDDDPHVVKQCPHVYFAGCQKKFGTRVIEGPDGQKVVLVSVPRFKETGVVVLVDLETLEVELVKMSVVEPDVKGGEGVEDSIEGVADAEDGMEE
jgi:DNA polymerase delta subunit 2